MKGKLFPTWVFYLTAAVLGALLFYYLLVVYRDVTNYPDAPLLPSPMWDWWQHRELIHKTLSDLRLAALWFALLCVLGMLKTGWSNLRSKWGLALGSGLVVSYVFWIVSFAPPFTLAFLFEAPGFYQNQALKELGYFISSHFLALPFILLFLIYYWYRTEQKQRPPEKKDGAWRYE